MQTTQYREELPYQNLSELCKRLAAWLPAIVLAYSTLIDPIVNFGLAKGIEAGGLIVGGESKNTFLAKLYFPSVFVLGLVCMLFARPALPGRLLPVLLPGTLFVALAVLSTGWAANPSSTLTSAIYFALLYSALLVPVLCSGNPVEILRPIALLFFAVVTINLVAVVALPFGDGGHSGIYSHKNELGAAAGCALIVGLFAVPRTNLSNIFLTAVLILGAVFLIAQSYSKTSLALAVIAPGLALLYFASRRLMGIGPLLTTLLVTGLSWSGFLVASQIGQFSFNDILFAVYGDTTFTGRTDIWDFAEGYIAQSPLLGHGYRGFWALGLGSPKYLSGVEFVRTIGSAHSGYYDIALDLGFVGLGLVAWLIVATIAATGSSSSRPGSVTLFCYAMVFFAVGRNITESVILWSTFMDNLLFVLAGFLAGLPAQEVSRSTSTQQNLSRTSPW